MTDGVFPPLAIGVILGIQLGLYIGSCLGLYFGSYLGIQIMCIKNTHRIGPGRRKYKP